MEVTAGASTRASGSSPLVVNLAGGVEITILDLAKRLCGLVDASRQVRCLGRHRAGDPLRWCADVARLRSVVPGLAMPDFCASLEKTVRAWQSLETPVVPPLANA